MSRKMKAAIAALALAGLAGPALADDHLFNAAHANGVDNRGFANPVAGNPSGQSGPMAQPGTVPGLGDPKVGADQGTPSFDSETLEERLASKARGHN